MLKQASVTTWCFRWLILCMRAACASTIENTLWRATYLESTRACGTSVASYLPEGKVTQMTNQIITLFLLALPIACAAWTVTHEEVFREPREFCQRKSQTCARLLARKFFYLPTCEYCFSHYVTVAALIATGFRVQITGGWVDYVLTGFTLVWIANFYMGVFFLLKLTIKRTGAMAKLAVADADARAMTAWSHANAPRARS